jgi:hypothetical protein
MVSRIINAWNVLIAPVQSLFIPVFDDDENTNKNEEEEKEFGADYVRMGCGRVLSDKKWIFCRARWIVLRCLTHKSFLVLVLYFTFV